MTATFDIEHADAHFDAALIKRNGKSLLITGLNSDHPREHNRLAELLVRIMSKPEVDAEIAELLGGGQAVTSKPQELPEIRATVSDLVEAISSVIGEPQGWVNQLARRLIDCGFLPKSCGKRIATVHSDGTALLLYVACAADSVNDAIKLGQRCADGKTSPLGWMDFQRIVRDASDGVAIDLNDGSIHPWSALAGLHATTSIRRLTLLPQSRIAALRAALVDEVRS